MTPEQGRAARGSADGMDVCVFCGSREGRAAVYREAARSVGRTLGARGHGLVYGGAGRGLMGVVADAALDAGARVVGVLPEQLFQREVAHPGLDELVVVRSMHERKAEMASRSQAFLVLPGGLGTLEETFEIVTWAQLGIHGKPVGLLDVAGYFRPLLAFLDHAVEEGFLDPDHRRLLLVAEEVDELLDAFARWEGPVTERWMGPDET